MVVINDNKIGYIQERYLGISVLRQRFVIARLLLTQLQEAY